jgi:predicted TIM-barrel fold metal-dependent hydrolase
MLELEHRFRVLDVHSRLAVEEETTTRGRTVTPERLEREMRQAGVVRAVVFPNPQPGEGYLQHNNAVARLSVDRPFIAFARLNGARKPSNGVGGRVKRLVRTREEYHTSPEEVEQYAYDDRFHGFKLDPGRDGLPDDAVLDALEDVDLPVLVHGGKRFSPVQAAETVLDRSFPIILSHFCGHPLDRDLMDEAIDMLETHDNCYLDTTFVRYREPLERALLEHPDRVLFGSGAPASHPNVAIMEILTLDVSEDKLHRAFRKNAERVIEELSTPL